MLGVFFCVYSICTCVCVVWLGIYIQCLYIEGTQKHMVPCSNSKQGTFTKLSWSITIGTIPMTLLSTAPVVHVVHPRCKEGEVRGVWCGEGWGCGGGCGGGRVGVWWGRGGGRVGVWWEGWGVVGEGWGCDGGRGGGVVGEG